MKLKKQFSNEELQKTFNEADIDKNGKIGVATLRKSLSKLGCNVDDEEFERFLKQAGIDISIDRDIEINFGMFTNLINRISGEKEEEAQLRQAFDEFDGEKKGYIEASGIKRVLTKLEIDYTNEEIDLMMEVADTNSDGRVDIDEFLQIFKPGDFDWNS